jgi:hypothetical protein
MASNQGNMTDYYRERLRSRIEQRQKEFWEDTTGQVLLVVILLGITLAVGLVAFAVLKWAWQIVF